MFFTDYGQIPKVERCDMDGQNRTKLVDSKIVFPHGITLDLVSRLVYWADAYLDYIEVVDYEGKNRHTIIQGLLVRGSLGSLSHRETQNYAHTYIRGIVWKINTSLFLIQDFGNGNVYGPRRLYTVHVNTHTQV